MNGLYSLILQVRATDKKLTHKKIQLKHSKQALWGKLEQTPLFYPLLFSTSFTLGVMAARIPVITLFAISKKIQRLLKQLTPLALSFL